MKLLRCLVILSLIGGGIAPSKADDLSEECRTSMRRAASFFHDQIAVNGTYLWEYSEDLTKREGEGTATPTQGWIQPPGTPSVGDALLRAYEATGDELYLDWARETARGLRQAQMISGGWHYRVGFAPEERRKLAYREEGNAKARNITTLDDDTTTAALRFLMVLDRTEGFTGGEVHETVVYALERLIRAQYPNGAWPQGYDRFPSAEDFPVKKASFPKEWPRQWPGSRQYWYRYTLNDNVVANMAAMLLEAWHIYRDPKAGVASRKLGRLCRIAAERTGEFIIRAQLPEPQPAWSQQYDFDMTPSWARKFEPPAVTGGESQGVIRTLMLLYRHTGERRFLEPIPRALDYLERSRLPDGRLARFYELQSNTPLYFTREYQLTYDDSNMPTHYAFKVGDQTASIRRAFEQLRSQAWEEPSGWNKDHGTIRMTPQIEASARAAVAALDKRGRWVEPGPLKYHRPKDPNIRVVRTATFIRNIGRLCDYLAAAAQQAKAAR